MDYLKKLDYENRCFDENFVKEFSLTLATQQNLINASILTQTHLN